MAETRFIRTVAYGGYDRADVLKRLEFVNTQLYDCKNELRETKLLIEEYKKGNDEEKAFEIVLGGEKTKLTSLQVQNETLNTKLKAAEDDNKKLADELNELKIKFAEANKELEELKGKVTALEADSEAVALSQVFIAAQQSADALKKAATVEAETKENKAKELAEEILADANSTAAEIVYEAEKKAAETIADAKNKSEQMSVASNNLKANLLEDVDKVFGDVQKLKDVLEEFRDNGLAKIEESQRILQNTKSKLEDGGVPVFRMPENFEPEYPDAPPARVMPTSADKKKANAQLEELQKMANSMGGKKNEEKKEEKKDDKKGGVDLAALAAQAAALGGKKDDKKDAKKDGKKGGVDLAALAAQAAALNNKK